MNKLLASFLLCISPLCMASSSFQLFSPNFQANNVISAAMDCNHEGQPPALAWNEAPEATQGFVLIVTDYDAVRVAGHQFEHWVVYDIPSKIHALTPGDTNFHQGENSIGQSSFYPFCPPDGMHHYTFVLYALDSSNIHYPDNANASQVRQVIQGHVLAEATLVGELSL